MRRVATLPISLFRRGMILTLILIIITSSNSNKVNSQNPYEFLDSYEISGEIMDIKTSYDGKKIYVASGYPYSGKLTYFEFDGSKLKYQWEHPFNFCLNKIEVSSDGQYVLVGNMGNPISTYSSEPRDVLFLRSNNDTTIKNFSSRSDIHSFSLSENEQMLAYTIDGEKKVNIWSMGSSEIRSKELGNSPIEVKWEGSNLIVWNNDEAFLFDSQFGIICHIENRGIITYVTTTKDCEKFIVGTRYGELLFYTRDDCSQNREASLEKRVSSYVREIIFLEDASRFFLIKSNSHYFLCEINETVTETVLDGLDEMVSISDDHKLFIYPYSNRLMLYKIENNEYSVLWSYELNISGQITKIFLSPNKMYFLIGSDKGLLYIYKTAKYRPSIRFINLIPYIRDKLEINAEILNASKMELYIGDKFKSDKLPYLWDIIGEQIEDGKYKVLIRAYDDFQNVVEECRDVVVDNKSPDINIISPQENSEIYESMNIEIKISDINLRTTYIDLNDINGVNKINKSYEGSKIKDNINTSNLKKGDYILQITAFDQANNQSTKKISIVKISTADVMESDIDTYISQIASLISQYPRISSIILIISLLLISIMLKIFYPRFPLFIILLFIILFVPSIFILFRKPIEEILFTLIISIIAGFIVTFISNVFLKKENKLS